MSRHWCALHASFYTVPFLDWWWHDKEVLTGVRTPDSAERPTGPGGCLIDSSINNISLWLVEATQPLQILNAAPRLYPTYINVLPILKPISFGPLLDPSQVGHSDEFLSQINKLIMLIYLIRLTVGFWNRPGGNAAGSLIFNLMTLSLFKIGSTAAVRVGFVAPLWWSGFVWQLKISNECSLLEQSYNAGSLHCNMVQQSIFNVWWVPPFQNQP